MDSKKITWPSEYIQQFEKIQCAFSIKFLVGTRLEETYLNIIKAAYDNSIANIMENWGKLKAISVKSVMRWGCALNPLPINIIHEALHIRSKFKGYKEKNVKLSQFLTSPLHSTVFATIN